MSHSSWRSQGPTESLLPLLFDAFYKNFLLLICKGLLLYLGVQAVPPPSLPHTEVSPYLLTRTAICLAWAAALDLDLPPAASTLPFPCLFFFSHPACG